MAGLCRIQPYVFTRPLPTLGVGHLPQSDHIYVSLGRLPLLKIIKIASSCFDVVSTQSRFGCSLLLRSPICLKKNGAASRPD